MNNTPQELKGFVSYAHKDHAYATELITEIKAHSKYSNWSLWNDKDITVGANWKEAINKAIQESNFALLLISISFLNSEYCTEIELREFIEKHTKEGFLIIPILLRDCNFTVLGEIAQRQFFKAEHKDYGNPSKGTELMPYAQLCAFNSDGVPVPNHFKDTYCKNLITALNKVLAAYKPKPTKKPIPQSEEIIKALLPKKENLKTSIKTVSTNNGKTKVNVGFGIDDSGSITSDPANTEKAIKQNTASFIGAFNKMDELKGRIENQYVGNETAYAGEIFETIVAKDQLDHGTETLIRGFLGSNGHKKYKWYERSLIVSGLNISTVNKFSSEKASLLIEFILENEDLVWQNALMGLVYGLNTVSNKMNSYPLIVTKLNRLKLIPEVQDAIEHILNYTNELKASEIEIPLNYNEVAYFDKLYKWFIPFHESIDLLKEDFEKNDLNTDTELFAKLLTNSISLTKGYKYRVTLKYPKLSIEQVNGMVSVFKKEKQKFDELKVNYSKDVELIKLQHLIKELQVFNLLKPQNKLAAIIAEKKDLYNRNLVEIICNEVNLLKIKGIQLRDKKEYEQAIDCFKQIGELEPNNAFNLREIGFCHQKLNDYKTALEFHLKADELEPNNAWNLKQISFCHQKLNDYKTALEFHLKADELAPNDTWNLEQIGNCYFKLQDKNSALSFLGGKVLLDPVNSTIFNLFIRYLIVFKEYGKAIELSFIFQKLEPNKAWNLRQIGFCHQKLNDYKTALEYYLKSEELEPNNAWNLSQIGWCHQKLNDYKTALEYYLKSEELEPNNAWNLNQIGWCHQKLNDYNTALEYHLKSEELKPNDAWNLRQIAWYWFINADLEKAKEYYEKVLSIENDSYAHMNLGHIYWCLGNKEKGIIHYQKSIELFDDKSIFIEGFKDDYQYVKKYGINEKEYLTVHKQLINSLEE